MLEKNATFGPFFLLKHEATFGSRSNFWPIKAKKNPQFESTFVPFSE